MNNDIVADMDRAIETGQPVTRSSNIGGKRCQGATDEVIDIEPISSSVTEEKPGSRWDSRSPATTRRFGEVMPAAPASTFCSPSPSFMPSSVDKPRMAPEVSRLLRGVEKAQLPSDLASDSNRRIFFALIEYVFSILIDELRIQLFKKLGCDYFQACRYVGQWKYARKTMSESVIKIAVEILDKGKCISALIMGHLLGLKPEYCFRTFPCKDEASSGISMRCTQIQERMPKQIVIEWRLYLLKYIDYQNDYRGMKEQAVCLYMDKACSTNKFFLIANRVQKDGSYVLEIGTTPVSARLYSRAEMAIHENATIIICMDMAVAMEFRRIARESSLLELEGIIISGYFGDSSAFEALDLSDTAGHHVVLVPEFNQESLVSASRFADRCEKAGATVSIYPWPVRAGGDPVVAEPTIRARWKKDLWAQSVRIEDIELPSKFALGLLSRSIPSSDYPEWLKDNGLVSAGQDGVRNVKKKIRFLSIDDLPDGHEQADIPTWDDLITAWYLTFIWGASNAGKSWFALQLVKAITTGTDAFGIFSISKRLVAYLDGEVGGVDFKDRCLQLVQGNSEAQELIRQNLRVLPPSSEINILDDACAAEIISDLIEMKAQVLVIDNILALAPDVVKGNVRNLFSFIHKLQEAGIAVIIIHHSGKDETTYMGPSELKSQSQNVIRLDGREQLVDQKPLSPELESACNAGGPVTKITFEECKAATLLERKSAIYHLPKGGVWKHMEGDLVPTIEPLPVNVSAESDDNSAIPAPEDMLKMHDLTPDQEKVYALLKEKKYPRVELEAVAGFKTDKLRGILKKLIELNLVEPKGPGKARYYRCV